MASIYDSAFRKLSKDQIEKRLSLGRVVKNDGMLLAHPEAVWPAIREGKPYPIKVMIGIGQNPVTSRENSKFVRESLMKLEFFAVSELFMTPTAEIADIVLPVAHWSERDEVIDAYTKNYVFCHQSIVQPPDECWEDKKMEGKGLDAVITGFEKRLAHRRAKPTTKSGELFYEIMLDYFNRARRAKEEEKYLAWVGLFAPVELMYAMDIVPFIPEHFGILMSSQMDFTPYYEAASAYGLPRELCSSHRAMTGLAIKRELPSPDCIVSTSQSCDTTIKSFECLGNLYESPAFFLDFPYKDTEEALRYYEGEITELISFLEEQTRKNLDIDKLKETIQLSKQLDDLLFDVGELKKAVPAPMKGRDSFRHLGISLTMAGTQRGVDYFQTLRDELKEKALDVDGRYHYAPNQKTTPLMV